MTTPNQSTPTPLTDEYFGENVGTGEIRDYRNFTRSIETKLSEARQQLAAKDAELSATRRELEEVTKERDRIRDKKWEGITKMESENAELRKELAETKDERRILKQELIASRAGFKDIKEAFLNQEKQLSAKDEEVARLKEMEETWHRGAMEHSRVKGERDSLRGMVAKGEPEGWEGSRRRTNLKEKLKQLAERSHQ